VRLTSNGPVLECRRHPSLGAAYVDWAFRHLPKRMKIKVEIDLQLIHKRVEATLRIRPGALKSRRRTRRIASARQIAMYLCRKFTDSSFPEIGASLCRDHSTAIVAFNQVAQRAAGDSAFSKALEKMEQKIAIAAVRRSLRRLQR
jgi:chromosomal replication initiation ATPase DnaA